MFGFGIGQDFLTHTVAPDTARRTLVCSVSKLKAEAEAPEDEAIWKVAGRGGQWSALGKARESLGL